ncbi:VOC family protein [Motilibacter aurantiacus]|uniref:VOC family protein n=1 Tax=Motilibacter aurantiacus TaxID=2714955 RepID=UPI0014095DE3|nr:VOC family protein [Motilibacter aurantiacus]NHC44937.1 VOC family protein [Motilibacter aurantiacus]
MGAPVAFFEVTSPDHERAQRFYAQLFGWQVAADEEMGGYGLVDTGAGDGAIGGGIGPVEEGDAPGVRVYVRVDDLEQQLRRAEQLGGTALVPPTELPGGFGRFALLADPDGNTVGLWA